MLYQINARSLQPFYTEDRAQALKLYKYLKQYGPPCSMREVDPARAAWKATRPDK